MRVGWVDREDVCEYWDWGKGSAIPALPGKSLPSRWLGNKSLCFTIRYIKRPIDLDGK